MFCSTLCLCCVVPGEHGHGVSTAISTFLYIVAHEHVPQALCTVCVWERERPVNVFLLRCPGTFEPEPREKNIAYGLVYPLDFWDPIAVQVWLRYVPVRSTEHTISALYASLGLCFATVSIVLASCYITISSYSWTVLYRCSICARMCVYLWM